MSKIDNRVSVPTYQQIVNEQTYNYHIYENLYLVIDKKQYGESKELNFKLETGNGYRIYCVRTKDSEEGYKCGLEIIRKRILVLASVLTEFANDADYWSNRNDWSCIV